jgi:dCMP deaminase
MIRVGNELRGRTGPGALAHRILPKLAEDRHYVVDSFRNPVEVEAFRHARKDYVLLAVEARPETRFERLKARARVGDPQTFEEFLEVEARELKSDDARTQQLMSTEVLADHRVHNDGDVEELHVDLSRLLKDLMSRFDRPDWDDYFMQIASVVARRSNCMKRKVAAVVVRDRRIISTGYNGTPRGARNCNEGGCPRCNSMAVSGTALDQCVCSHAEENAITQSAYHGISVKGATLYTTFSPCMQCTKMIINSGIEEVVYNVAYPLGDMALSLMTECGVAVRRFQLA